MDSVLVSPRFDFSRANPTPAFEVAPQYLPGVISGDGEELDADVLAVLEPIQTFHGRCIAIVHRLEEDDDKVEVVPEGIDLSDSQIREMTYFQEQYFSSVLIRKCPKPGLT
ncbi:hypothetical protein [Geothrix sp. 21YS21S-2]|uniref:hypothetical protein n=1 Tax=Geothrix sp. 21YS21S-2 TaxID=3068893 RepID=UPI0027BAF45D|nr:hypothetical protein [Geothrix sp. 21YS21S-2]